MEEIVRRERIEVAHSHERRLFVRTNTAITSEDEGKKWGLYNLKHSASELNTINTADGLGEQRTEPCAVNIRGRTARFT